MSADQGNPDRAAAGIIDTAEFGARARLALCSKLELLLELEDYVVSVRGNPGDPRRFVFARRHEAVAAFEGSAFWNGVRLSDCIGRLTEREWAIVEHALVRAEAARKEEDDANGR